MASRGARFIWHTVGALLLLVAGPGVLGTGGGILGSWFAELFTGSQGNEQSYRSLAVKLMLENAELREMAAKSGIYRSMLNYTRLPGVNAVAGRVLFRSEGLIRGDLVVDKGSLDGIQPGDVCITDRGLVGIVTETQETTVTVKPMTNPSINVSCVTAESGSLGILESDSDGRLRLGSVDSASEPTPGETVLTSRFGGVYPEGIVVGTVTAVNMDESGYYLSLEVEPSVDFDTVNEVLILLLGEQH